jgi:prepilin-type N-terminal cleavage/methylation domain-containing protein
MSRSCKPTARRQRGFTLVELLVVVGIIAILLSGAIQAHAFTIDAATAAADCNADGALAVTANSAISGGTGTLTTPCTITLSPGVSLSFSGVTLNGGGNDLTITGALASLIEIKDSKIDLGTGDLTSNAGISANDSALTISKTKITADDVILQAAGCATSGGVVSVSKSTIKHGALNIAAGAEPAGCGVLGTGAEVKVKDTTLEGATVGLFTGDESEIKIDKATVTLTTGSSSPAILLRAGNDCEADIENSTMTLTSSSNSLIDERFGDRCDTDLSYNTMKLIPSGSGSGSHAVIFLGGHDWDLDMYSNKIAFESSGSAGQVFFLQGGDRANFSIDKNQLTMTAGGGHFALLLITAGNDLVMSFAQNSVVQEGDGLEGMQVFSGARAKASFSGNTLTQTGLANRVLQVGFGPDSEFSFVKNKIKVTDFVASIGIGVGDRGRLTFESNEISVSSTTTPVVSSQIFLAGGSDSDGLLAITQEGVGATPGRIQVKDDKVSVTADDEAAILIQGDDTASVEVQKTTLSASGATSSITIETGDNGSVVVKDSKLTSGSNTITSGAGSSTRAEKNKFTGATTIHGGASCVSTGNTPSVACT